MTRKYRAEETAPGIWDVRHNEDCGEVNYYATEVFHCYDRVDAEMLAAGLQDKYNKMDPKPGYGDPVYLPASVRGGAR